MTDPNPMTVDCPTCKAWPHRRCVDGKSNTRSAHPARLVAARTFVAVRDLPEIPAPMTAAEREEILDAADDGRTRVCLGYELLASVLDEALEQAQSGKGRERHAGGGEAFEDQQIVQLGEWMASTGFAVGQACKKAIESTRLDPAAARRELLGAINYLAAAVIQIDRLEVRRG